MTALVAEWMSRLAGDGWRGAKRLFDRSFYGQGTRAEGDSDKTVLAHRLIESNRHGRYSFADPLLGEFIKRQLAEWPG